MPPADGADVAREIVENQLASKTLVVSSNSQDMVFEPLHAIGVWTLTKPCEDQDLYNTVKAMLNGGQ
jgi:FixJ family two-component response regulator